MLETRRRPRRGDPALALRIRRPNDAASRPTGTTRARGAIDRVPRWLASGSLYRRVLTAFVLLLVGTGVTATIAIRQAMLVRLDDRINDHIQQEIAEFERLVAVDPDVTTGRPFTSLQGAFDAYIERNVADHEEAVLTFVDDRPYRMVSSSWPVEQIGGEFESLLHLTGRRGATTVDTSLGRVWFDARPVRVGTDSGLFAVAVLPAAELTEIRDLQIYGSAAALVVTLLAVAIAAWILASVVRPVRALTDTAAAISRSDLMQRIPVRGPDEVASMARTFNAMLDRLQALFRSQREFVHDASHELRVPLTVCLGNLGVLGRGLIDDAAARRDTISLVSDELERMGRIVGDLYLLAEAEQPDFLGRERVHLRALAEELRAKARALGRRHWQLDAVADAYVCIDRQMMTQATMNLIDNAIHHTGDDDVIAIGTSVGVDDARLWVRDSGCGIDPADQADVFTRFRRGAGAHQRYRGSGLGLAIVQRIAEAHGGHVELQSERGRGTRFTIVIPRRREDGGSDAADPEC